MAGVFELYGAYWRAQREHALLLRCEGLTYQRVGKRMGVAASTAQILVKGGAQSLRWAMRRCRFKGSWPRKQSGRQPAMFCSWLASCHCSYCQGYVDARREHALLLRCEGLTGQQIADRLPCSHGYGVMSAERARRLAADGARQLNRAMRKRCWLRYVDNSPITTL